MLDTISYLLLIGLAVYLFAGPPLTLLHELGHALPVALAGKPVAVYLGRPDPRARPTFRLGKVKVRIRRPIGFGGECLYEETGRGFSPGGLLLVALGGPAASALTTLVFGLGAYLSPDGPLSASLMALSLAAFAQVFLSMLPVRYPGWFGAASGKPSDGLQALWAIKLLNKVGEDAE